MKQTSVTALILTGLLISTGHAVISYEPFDYVVGGNLEGNPNWIALNSGTAPRISAGNLSVGGLAEPSGQLVSFAGGNFQEALGATSTFTSNTVYFSFAFQLTTLPTGTGTYSFGLSTGNQNYGAVVMLQADGTGGFNLGLANRPTATAAYSPIKLSLNTTYFLVGSYAFVAGAGNDVSSLWVNPDPASFAGASAPSPTLSAQGGTDLTAVSQFLLRGSTGSPAGQLDELRIANTWAGVTPIALPESTTALSLLSGTALLLARRRRP